MLSVFHQISVEMAWFCRVWFAKCVDGKENLSLFACFFTLCPDIVPYTYRGMINFQNLRIWRKVKYLM